MKSNRVFSGTVTKQGAWGKRIIRTIITNGREYQYHATKGWRSYRIVK